MPRMILHILDARRRLAGMHDWITETLTSAFEASATLLPLQDTDVVVSAGPQVIAETGHMGFAPESGLIYITLDPDRPALCLNTDHSLEKLLAHELHHSARWDGPGYGETLGAALACEGLAGHFAQELYGGPKQPWEALPTEVTQPFTNDAERDWQNQDYDHPAWFFGTGELPRWLGYSLGYQMIARYLAAHPGAQASQLVHAEADQFRAFLRSERGRGFTSGS